ncbi:MAG TPA: Holliday junction branch migration protein RuvA [Chloroflexota bacterium]|jgi:Holliday junction DNA helicase RuvA|nr:Holliday junction branch migration protein RuvA [Chloroflexota bacterium]
MIASLRGTIEATIPEGVILNVNGVGYEVFLPPVVAQALNERPPDGQVELKIAALATRDQPLPVLYGFLHEEEKQFWQLLRSVPRVGPKGAARAMVLPINRIAAAIKEGNRNMIDNLPGVSADGAEKIITALRKKVEPFSSLTDADVSTGNAVGSKDELSSVSVALLVEMGIRRTEAAAAVARLLEADPELTRVEDVVTEYFRKP